MALYGNDYGREFGYGTRSGAWRGDPGWWGRSGARNQGRWDRAYNRGYDWGMTGPQGGEYGRGGYDRAYQGRWQTDYGDPFGDRPRHTPFGVYREGDRGSNRMWETAYDREFNASPYPFGYRPYAERAGYDAGYHPHARGYRWRDTTWF